MKTIILKAHAKINWRLEITARRDDGYHELDMLMQTISIFDLLTVEKSQSNELIINGVNDKNPESNLILRAADKLSKYTGKPICAKFELIKQIPSMAGLGGGSADCATALKALNELYELGLKHEELKNIALSLGADVPFFLKGGLCRVKGIGEKVDKLSPSPIAHLLIEHVKPGLSTPEVYKKFDEIGFDCEETETDFLSNLQRGSFERLIPRNDLEAPAVSILPQINETKQKMLHLGAVFAMMSGSGSAVYGVFAGEREALDAKQHLPNAFYAVTTA